MLQALGTDDMLERYRARPKDRQIDRFFVRSWSAVAADAEPLQSLIGSVAVDFIGVQHAS